MNVLSENGIFNPLSNNNLGIQNEQSSQLILASPAIDSFGDFLNNTTTEVTQKTIKASESVPVSIPASLPNENVAPHDPAYLKPVKMPSSSAKLKKKQHRQRDDYGFSVDTVGLY